MTNSFTYDFGLLSADGNPYMLDDLGSPVRFGDEVMGYDEFGNNLCKHTSQQPFSYTGYQIDAVSSTLFAQAREYKPELGRFTSADTHWNTGNMIYGDAIRQVRNASLLPNPLAIRQSSNFYEYGLSNPNKYVDPLGKDVWFVHGTSPDGIGSVNNDFYSGASQWNEETLEFVGAGFGQNVHNHSWYGNNNSQNRTDSAQALVDDILRVHGPDPTQPIRIIAYSHGGNVAMEAIDILWNEHGIKVDTNINFATPNRRGHRNSAPVGQQINVYNTGDSTQVFGGFDSFWQRGSGFGFGRVWPAGRKHPNAENVQVMTGVEGWFNGANHGIMHNNLDIWLFYVVPLLDLAYFSDVRDIDTCGID